MYTVEDSRKKTLDKHLAVDVIEDGDKQVVVLTISPKDQTITSTKNILRLALSDYDNILDPINKYIQGKNIFYSQEPVGPDTRVSPEKLHTFVLDLSDYQNPDDDLLYLFSQLFKFIEDREGQNITLLNPSQSVVDKIKQRKLDKNFVILYPEDKDFVIGNLLKP